MKNPKLHVGKQNREKPVVLFVAAMAADTRDAFLLRLESLRGDLEKLKD